MRKPSFHRNPSGRDGVALIVVLGFLSVMIMMALAFLVQARVERLVAHATLEANRGRQLARTAINAAMNDYSVTLWNNKLMLAPTNSDYDVFISSPEGTTMKSGDTLGDDDIRLMVGEATQWIPRRYLTRDVTNYVADAEWILVREDPTDKYSRILGRYAYACFDMSGGMDANLIARAEGVANQGDPTNRPSVRAVGMGLLPETANASTFKSYRRGWHGFDNLSELILLTNGKYNGGEQEYEDEDRDDKYWSFPKTGGRWQGLRQESYGAALTSSKISDLVPYSLACYRGIWSFSFGKWETDKIQSCEDMGTAQFDMAAALSDVTAQLKDPVGVMKAIEDYVSANEYPAGTDYPSSKAIPMFNELGISLKPSIKASGLEGVPGTIHLEVKLTFETWYPFDSLDNPDKKSFSILAPSIGGSSQNAGSTDIHIPIMVLSGGKRALVTEIIGEPNVPQLEFTSSFNGGKPVSSSDMTFTYDLELKLADTNIFPSDSDIVWIPAFLVQKPIEMKNGEQTVDTMSVSVSSLPGSGRLAMNTPVEVFYEVSDPRLNHNPSEWVSGTGTLGEVNKESISAGYSAEGGEGLYMYCRNGPMKTPGEFGYISTGKPWETIDLCTPEGAKMLSKLVATSDILDAIKDEAAYNTFYTNGTINPNTSSTSVLASAFAYLKTAETPNPSPNSEGSKDEVSEAIAQELANAFIFATSKPDNDAKKIVSTSSGAFMNASDWVRIPAMGKNGYLAKQGFNKNQREQLIRATWGLFSPNNSLFTALIIAQPISEGPDKPGIWSDDDIVVGERRAAALIWRDPTPGIHSHHEMFIRMFKFLDE